MFLISTLKGSRREMTEKAISALFSKMHTSYSHLSAFPGRCWFSYSPGIILPLASLLCSLPRERLSHEDRIPWAPFVLRPSQRTLKRSHLVYLSCVFLPDGSHFWACFLGAPPSPGPLPFLDSWCKGSYQLWLQAGPLPFVECSYVLRLMGIVVEGAGDLTLNKITFRTLTLILLLGIT